MIELKKVTKSYAWGSQKVHVLNNLNLKIPQGSFTVILGRSGSGKSTILNLMAGLDRPESGEILFQNEPLLEKSQEELADFRLAHVGLVFQFFNLLPTLNLEQNVRIPGQLAELSEREITKRAKNALKLVGLTRQADRMPHQASGGEIQRAAIARALLNEPELILADEPTGNLDKKNREKVLEILHKLSAKEKKTVVVVTHDSSFESICDKLYRLEDGKLQ